MRKKRKNIDLSIEAVKSLSIKAIERGTNFKNYVELVLEELAKNKVKCICKNALPHRKDLLVPAEVVRDEKGNVIGCKSLGR